MAEKTPVELALNSISWQLKRIADSLEEIEDIKRNEQRAKYAPPVKTLSSAPRTNLNPSVNLNELRKMLKGRKGE